MDTLPPELLCFVLSKLDGHSLARASQVCSKWRELVSILTRNFNVWLKCCIEDLGLDSTVCFTQRTDLLTKEGLREAESRKEDGEYWRGMYAQYYHHRLIKKWTVACSKLNNNDTPIIASALHGAGLVIVGDMVGHIHVYRGDTTAPFNTSVQRIQMRHSSFPCHHRHISDMALIKLDSEKGDQELLIISISGDGSIHISSLDGNVLAKLRPTTKPGIRISVFGTYFCAATYSSMVTGLKVYRLKRTNGKVDVDIVMKLSGLMYSDLSAVALTHNKVLAGDVYGVLYLWDIPPLVDNDTTADKRSRQTKPQPLTSLKGRVVEVTEPILTHQFKNEINQIVWAGKQAVMIMDTGNLYVLTTEQKLVAVTMQCLSQLFKTVIRPMSLALYGPLLAVGCNAGHILMFDVWHEEWYKDLAGSSVYYIWREVDDILAISLSNDGEAPVLITGGLGLNIFRWRSEHHVADKLQSMELKH